MAGICERCHAWWDEGLRYVAGELVCPRCRAKGEREHGGQLVLGEEEVREASQLGPDDPWPEDFL